MRHRWRPCHRRTGRLRTAPGQQATACVPGLASWSVAVPASIRRPLLLRSLARPNPEWRTHRARQAVTARVVELSRSVAAAARKQSPTSPAELRAAENLIRDELRRAADRASRHRPRRRQAPLPTTLHRHRVMREPQTAPRTSADVLCAATDRRSFTRSSANRCGSSLRASSQATTAAPIAGRMLAYPRRPPKSPTMSPANAVSLQRSSRAGRRNPPRPKCSSQVPALPPNEARRARRACRPPEVRRARLERDGWTARCERTGLGLASQSTEAPEQFEGVPRSESCVQVRESATPSAAQVDVPSRLPPGVDVRSRSGSTSWERVATSASDSPLIWCRRTGMPTRASAASMSPKASSRLMMMAFRPRVFAVRSSSTRGSGPSI